MPDGSDERCWVGFDLGGTKMLAVAYDAAFEPLGRKRKRTLAHGGLKAGAERIAETIEDALDKAGVSRSQLAGIGIGAPGPLDLDRGVILEAPNFGWRDAPLAEMLSSRFGCPVIVANDVDLGVLGENLFGAARSARCVAGVFPGTGIGGGCVSEGQIVRGRALSAMEIGHVQVMPDGPRCGCGQSGCLEAVASRLAISSAAARAAYRGQAPHLRRAVGTDIAKIRSGALADSVKAGDTVVEQLIRDAARHIGVAVSTIVHLVAPDMIVLGGGLVEAMPELFVGEVEQAARGRVLPSYRDSFQVVAAELGDDATVLGAAAWAKRQLHGN